MRKEYFFIKKITNVMLFLFCWLAMSSNIANDQSDELSVITNSETQINELPFKELKTILRGEKQRWKDGTKISLAMMKTNTAVGGIVSKKVYEMTADQLNKYWLALVFQGKATAPVFFDSEDEVKAYVLRTKGALGVISYDGIKNDKVVLIDGKKYF